MYRESLKAACLVAWDAASIYVSTLYTLAEYWQKPDMTP